MAKSHAPKVEKMPGASYQRGSDMHDYLILLREVPTEAVLDRGTVYREGLSHTTQLRDRILSSLTDRGMGNQVEFAAPTSFPLIAVRATVEAAEVIRSVPGVEDVIADSSGISTAAGSSR